MNNQRPLPKPADAEQESGKGLDETPCSRLRIPRHLLELRIRSAIADKEMVTAMANRDLQCGDGWRCDYAEWHRAISKEIEELFILSANVKLSGSRPETTMSAVSKSSKSTPARSAVGSGGLLDDLNRCEEYAKEVHGCMVEADQPCDDCMETMAELIKELHAAKLALNQMARSSNAKVRRAPRNTNESN